MKPLSEASNELFHAANNLLQLWDKEDYAPSPVRKWNKAVLRLKRATQNYNEVQCANLAELIRKG